MLRYAIVIALSILPVTTSPATTQRPGQHEAMSNSKDAEIAHLRTLVQQQNKKITLLEEKVRLLEAELTKAKGAK